MLAAMQRDLGLSAGQAQARLQRESAATKLEQALRAEIGEAIAGAWLDRDDQHLLVAVTNPAAAAVVRKVGAQPTTVARTAQQLASTKASLDRAARPAAATVAGWYVDVTTNSVVVVAQPDSLATAKQFITAAGADTTAVRVVASTERPVPLVDNIRGGDAYYFGSSRCSIGFAVKDGFVTAGHCGTAGTSTTGANSQFLGTVAGSTFPGRDFGWVSTHRQGWTPQPWVNNYAGGVVTVDGSQEAPVGAAVCRSGSTTGWRCGVIEARDQTVNYPQGTVNGLTRTTACAEGGDSGGSWLTGGQAQGVTSGGSGNCTVGGTTFFQPINPILQTYGLTLVTSSQPAVAWATCAGLLYTQVRCEARWAGGAIPSSVVWAPMDARSFFSSQSSDPVARTTNANGNCTYPYVFQGKVTVTSPTGHTDTAYVSAYCMLR